MAGRGPSAKTNGRQDVNKVPQRGDWQNAGGVGWQFDEVSCPEGVMPATAEAWSTWMGAWFAWFWTPDDLPGLRQMIRLYDQVERDPSTASLHTQLRQMMDTYGVTPKGQQDRRWAPPVPEGMSKKQARSAGRNLKVVG